MSPLSSLQGKLVVTSVVIVLVALALAGAVFVNIRRGDQRQQELDHVTANSSAIQREFVLRQLGGDSEASLARFVEGAAEIYDVRALMIDLNGNVIADSSGELDGETIAFDKTAVFGAPAPNGEPYLTIRPTDESPANNLVLVTPARVDLFGGSGVGGIPPIRYSLMLAVSEETLARAWLNLLPEMGLAAAIALPVAVLLAVVISRYITAPLEKLTVASNQMASGSFDVDVSVEREDEIGRLARAFSAMAERVGDAQSQMRTLVANVSHDMKTPLTSILGFSQTLRDEAESQEDTRRMAAIIHEEAGRLNSRLNDLLYLAELESGQVVLREDDIDVREMIAAAAARVAPHLARRDVSLSIESSEAPASIRTDGQKLERAIENLLDNARKFTPDGGRIALRDGARQGGLWFEVANTVDGIDAEEIPRLFERYYRRQTGALTDGSRAESGSGLGLPIARDLVELLGGQIEASLRDGELVMHVELPARREPAAGSV